MKPARLAGEVLQHGTAEGLALQRGHSSLLVSGQRFSSGKVKWEFELHVPVIIPWVGLSSGSGTSHRITRLLMRPSSELHRSPKCARARVNRTSNLRSFDPA
jgi:hypothetical protein